MLLVHPPIAPWLVPTADGCEVTLLCGGEAPLTVYLRAEPDNEEHLIRMVPDGAVNGLSRFTAVLPWDPANDPTLYAFKVLHGGRQSWLAGDGVHPHVPPREVHFRVSRAHAPPRWITEQVVYQIFPDRFCQGDASLGVQTGEYLYGPNRVPVVKKPWGAPIDFAHGPTAFYGGDLVGIREQLDYLQHELGVTTLYLNPIFTSGSNHRYDTEDYYNVDRHLGGNAALAELAAELHARGMRLVLDAVINHTGANHPWFDRYGAPNASDARGAFHSAESPWRSWYVFGEAGYAGWKGHSTLPVLNFASPAVREAFYDGDASVLRHWMRPPYAIDGWRFDVVHMLGEGAGAANNAYYVRELRRAMREENREAYVLGEHFSEATRWLQGDQEDGAMNYFGFANPVRGWLAGLDVIGEVAQLSTPEFERWLATARGRVPYANQLAQLNLLDSHDTARFLTVLDGDTARMRLAVTLLFSYPGVPSIYYGDEIGLCGGGDPDCRRCFEWDRARWDAGLHAHYRQLIAWRKARPEWRRGAYQTLAVSADALVFARYTERSVTIVGVNRGAAAVELELALAALPLEVTAWRDAAAATIALPARLAIGPAAHVLCFGEAG